VLVGGWDGGREVSARYEAVRLFFVRDCFLRRRLMVSAYDVKIVTQIFVEERVQKHTFSSSNRFSDMFLRFRAVSSRRRAISASLSGCFLRDVSAAMTKEISTYVRKYIP
jgi:hypothetical protein